MFISSVRLMRFKILSYVHIHVHVHVHVHVYVHCTYLRVKSAYTHTCMIKREAMIYLYVSKTITI